MSRILLRLVLSLALLLGSAWGSLALFYRVEQALLTPVLIGLWLLLSVFCFYLLWWRPLRWALLCVLCTSLPLALWWSSIEPSNERDWADDVAQMTYGSIHGDQLELHNVRNFIWHSDDDYQIQWETREYDLNQLQSMDLTLSYWGMPAIAHTVVSFGFSDGRQLLFTVEIRKERHEKFSEIGGFFKEFELSIIATDERDALGVRSNARGEDLYLYKVNLSPKAIRELLEAYVASANELRQQPRFYNTLTLNCTTVIFDMLSQIVGGLAIDYRLLATGYLPSYMQKIGGLQPGYSLEQLRSQGRITERAQQANHAADFSQQIRRGVPGWTNRSAD